jgi:uncharacterized membrane protein YoaK (UPF0700 family)
MTPLFDPSEVHSRSRLASWIALALSAGAVNAIAFAACARFVTHVTGIVTRIGTDAGHVVLVVEYVLVLACFVLGAASSVPPRRGASSPWVPLAATSGTLAVCAVLGVSGAFGPFGEGVEQPGDFALLAMLAFAMGLQNASVATATGMLVRTTHMTGPATDLGIALGQLWRGGPESVLEPARRSARLRGAKIGAYAIGAAIGLSLAGVAGYAALLAPAAVIAVVASSTFARAQPAAAAAP